MILVTVTALLSWLIASSFLIANKYTDTISIRPTDTRLWKFCPNIHSRSLKIHIYPLTEHTTSSRTSPSRIPRNLFASQYQPFIDDQLPGSQQAIFYAML